MIQIVTKKLIYKIETDSDFEKDYGYQRGKVGGRQIRSLGLTYPLL